MNTELLLTVAVLIITSIMDTVLSGGAVFNVHFFYSDLLLLILQIAILGAFVFMAGYGTAFVKVFSTKKKFNSLELTALKKMEKSLEFAVKTAAYVAVFFIGIGTVYYYINWMNIQTLGFQLSLIILSAQYLCSIEIILFCMKGRVKKQIILLMQENESTAESEKKSVKETAWGIAKGLIGMAAIIALTVLIILNYTKNETEENFASLSTWIDMPSLLFTVVPALLILLSCGVCKDFFCAIKTAIYGRKISISEKHLLVNAVALARALILFFSIMLAMVGYYCVLTYLEEKSSLGPNMMIATIPCFYAVIFNLLLLCTEAKLNQLAE